jgi:TldD protein
VAIRVIELLSAKSVKGGIYPVLCNPRLGGVFIHEAFGHLSEADYIYNDPQAATLMKLGKRVGSKILSVIDDGSLPGLLGSSQYDHEGVRTQKTYLIREGELVGRLHTRETAAKLHEKVTGNARAVSYRFPPIVRMTNTYIEKGQSKFEELLEDTKLGIYACDAYGGQTQLENFSFSAGYAYMIRKGKICEMVKDVVLAGNLFNTLKNIEAIGDDFSWDETAGGCGKAGQAPLPVTCGSPSLKIRDVIIGGKK